MASGRKRKYGSVVEPSEDELNESINELLQANASSTQSNIDLDDDDVDSYTPGKIFHDPVHGQYELPPLLVQIIDTPQMQRLKYLRQMGGSFFLYMGACHTRFQHSLGVAYLAGKLCRTLQRRQPDVDITNKDVLCLQVAGLCHDIGHGPFSHLFDKMFLKSVNPELKWSHEQGSIDMFNYMIETNNLNPVFTDYGLNEVDIVFIKELIAGQPLDENEQKHPEKKVTIMCEPSSWQVEANW